jgi:hypothetical protein
MADLKWDTPEEGGSIMIAQMGLIRELAVELNRLGKLDDSLLSRVEARSTQKVKGTVFSSNVPSDTEQLRLMDLSIEAIKGAVAYLKANRNNGNLV